MLRAHRRITASLAFAILFAAATYSTPASAEQFIRICSFNIAEFGEGDHPDTRDLDFIAEMLVDHQLDLIAIQEVGVKAEAGQQVARLRKKMNEYVPGGQSKYFYFVTPVSGDERCAVVYRAPVVLGDEVFWLDTDKDSSNPRAGGTTFFRIPVGLTFQADNFDFAIVIVHLAWGNLDRREDEVAALKTFLEDDSDAEKDWIILGDMNRYGKYSASADKAFDQLLTAGSNNIYRFPLLEFVTDPDDMKVSKASKDEFSTTVAKSKNMYDQFIITKGVDHEFGTESADGSDVGIIAFDMEEPYKSITDHNDVKYRMSDHRPIWIRLRIDGDDDD